LKAERLLNCFIGIKGLRLSLVTKSTRFISGGSGLLIKEKAWSFAQGSDLPAPSFSKRAFGRVKNGYNL
jgi:hypothetical protein